MKILASVRARATVAATVLFALALAVGAVGLVGVLRHTMVDNVDTGLRLRADDISAFIRNGSPPDVISIEDDSDGFVQVVEGGVVVISSANIEGEPPITDAVSGAAFNLENGPIDESDFRVLVVGTDSPAGPATVIVGTTLEDLDHTVRVTVFSLGLGMPVLVLLVGVMTWAVVGRALKPVESIRSEVAEIGATDLHRRVPPPTTDDEIGRLADTMNDMLDRIESGTVRQRRFVSDASHELRTPIATIRHELEIALAHSDATDWPAVAEDVLEEDLRMQRLVDDLLWLARHDQTRTDRPASLVDLDEIVVRQGRQLGERTAKVVDLSAVGAGQVRGHADDLTRVVQNLLDNAIRHAEHRVALTVRSTDSGLVQLHVDDDGPGIPVEKRTAIFERFTRSDEARDRDHGGAGLGLSIAGEIAAEHDGRLVADESPLGGARLTFELADARVAGTPRPDRSRGHTGSEPVIRA